MSANPLRRGVEEFSSASEDYLIGLCDANNRWAYRLRFPKWYYVEPAGNGKAASIHTVDGTDAEEVWTILDGKRVDYAGWPQARIEKVERRARWLIQRGTLEARANQQ